MSDIYAMRRANGDWFAVEGRGRLRVPLFHSTHDAITASLRNFGMLLFRPVALDASLLKEMVPADGGSYVDFCMVKDPLVSLGRGNPVERAELVLLLEKPDEGSTTPRNGNGRLGSARRFAPSK